MVVCCFSGVVRPSSLLSGAGGAVGASLPDDVERAVAGSSIVVEGENSAERIDAVGFTSISGFVYGESGWHNVSSFWLNTTLLGDMNNETLFDLIS